MGIAMLSSPVMKLGPRDKWIGWNFEEVLDKLYVSGLDHQVFIHALTTGSTHQYLRLDGTTLQVMIW